MICDYAAAWHLSTQFGRLDGDWKREGEHRSMAQLAGDVDGAAECFDDRFRDGKAHAGALHAIALALSAIELVEDHHSFEVVDSRAAVGDADQKPRLVYFG